MRHLAWAACLLLMTILLVSPASSQIVGPRNYGLVGSSDPFLPDSRLPGATVGAEARQIRQRVDWLRESGAITRREARHLNREALRIAHVARHYGHDGLSTSEVAELRARTAVLRDAVNRPRR